MASRYWVGGSGTWDNASTANWSATSGGAPGASAPTTGDNVFFDANSGTAAVVNLAATATCFACTVDKSDISLVLGGNVTLLNLLTLTSGTLDVNGFDLTVGLFSSNNANVRTVAFGANGRIIITAVTGGTTAWNIANLTNFACSGSKQVICTTTGTMSTTVFHRGSGASEAKAVSFKFIAPSGAPNLANTSIFLNLDLSEMAGTGSMTNNSYTIYGSLSLRSTNVFAAGGTSWTFAGTAGPYNIDTAGVVIDWPWTFNGVGGTWQLASNLTYGATRTFTITNGTFDANGKNVTALGFGLGVGTKTLTIGSGTWSIAGNWDANTNVTGLTVNSSTGTINMTSASSKTFAGGGKVWPTLNQGGAGALTIQQSNTFANITNTVQPATITLTAGTTQTVGAFGASGTSGNLITLNSSSAGSQATLSDGSGTNSVSFVSIKDIIATGGAAWEAFITNGNVDAGNNTGWDFLVQLGRYMYNVRKSKRILQQGVI